MGMSAKARNGNACLPKRGQLLAAGCLYKITDRRLVFGDVVESLGNRNRIPGQDEINFPGLWGGVELWYPKNTSHEV